MGGKPSGETESVWTEFLMCLHGSFCVGENPDSKNIKPSSNRVTGGPTSRLVVTVTMATTSFDHLAQERFGRLAGALAHLLMQAALSQIQRRISIVAPEFDESALSGAFEHQERHGQADTLLA